MATTIHIDLKAVASVFLWFRPISKEHPDVLRFGADAAHPKCNVTFSYDYEALNDNVWQLHLDVGVRLLPVAEILTRTTFETVYAGQLIDILRLDAMDDAAKIAFGRCVQGFSEQCTTKGIAFNGKIDEVDMKPFIAQMRTSFLEHRLPQEAPFQHHRNVASFTKGTDTVLLCKVPFIIMDEVFFSDSAFDHEYNSDALWKVMPQPSYYTIKLRCMQIDGGEVHLPLLQTMFYLICLDCALQLLVSDHADRLEALLNDRGVNAVLLKRFITTGTEYFKNYNAVNERSNMRLGNFDNRPIWEDVVKLA